MAEEENDETLEDQPGLAHGVPRQHFDPSDLTNLRESQGNDPTVDHAEEKNRREFTTVYDILDQLEELIDGAKGYFFAPSSVKINRDEFLDQLSKLKSMLPVQLERASSLMREAERRLETAQSQANAIISSAQNRAIDTVKQAQDQAQFLVGQEHVTELARQRAKAMLDQAQAKSTNLTRGADDYCQKIMSQLQQQLNKISGDVQAGIDVLDERKRLEAQQMPRLEKNDYPEV